MTQATSSSHLYREAIAKLSAAGISNSTNEAAWLIEHAVGWTRLMIHTNPDRSVSVQDRQRVWDCVERRMSGEPLQYIVGSQEFWGRDFIVTRNVLIPRPETELLVQAVLSRLSNRSHPMIVDVGTGSGCIAITLNLELPESTVFAVDRCSKAIQIAQRNDHFHSPSDPVQFCVGDLLSPLLSGRLVGKVTAIVANLPYIRDEELATLSREVFDFEPEMALDGGPDGLSLYRRMIPEAATVLAPHGHMFLEVGQGQARPLCEEAMSSEKYRVDEIIRDSLGIERIVCLERRG